MKELRYSDVSVGSELEPGTAAGKYSTSVNVLVDAPALRERMVVVTAQLQNPRSTPARICIGPGLLFVSPPYDPRVRYTGVLRPAPAPPPPSVLELPPESWVRIEGAWDMADWAWEGSVSVELYWAVSFVPGPHVSGKFAVTLPAR